MRNDTLPNARADRGIQGHTYTYSNNTTLLQPVLVATGKALLQKERENNKQKHTEKRHREKINCKVNPVSYTHLRAHETA